MIKHYVKISYPGSFTSNDSFQEIESRESFVIPGNAFAYQFFDQEVMEIEGESLFGNPKNHSKTFYRGELYSVSDVEQKVPDNEILLSNMKINRWSMVIKCTQGFLPFESETCAIL